MITGRSVFARRIIGRQISACLVGQPFPLQPTCNYPLDETEAEVTGLGFDLATMSNGKQTMRAKIVEGDTAKSYLAAPAGIATAEAAVIAAGTGKKCVEWVLDQLPAVEGYTVYLSVKNAAWDSTFMVATIWYDGALWHLTAGSLTESALASAPERIGIYFDNGNIGMLLDNVDQGNIDTYTLGDVVISMHIDVDADLEAGGGSLIYHTLVTPAGRMTGTNYPASATDKCGNTI